MRRDFPPDARAFLDLLGANLEEHERLIMCGIPGDPGKAEKSQWRPRPWSRKSSGWAYPTGWNAYVTVGAFTKSPDGSFRRRAAQCTGGVAFMIDDIGTKVSRSRVEHVPPSARVETSPGNEQWWYFLDGIERDTQRFDSLIRAFIDGVLEGEDPGMASVTRVGRIPGYSNNKAAYATAAQHEDISISKHLSTTVSGVRVQLLSLENRRFTIDSLVEAYGLTLMGRVRPLQRVMPDDAEDRIASHFLVRKFLKNAGMLKRADPDRAGWTEVTCPWVDGHTAAANNGAAIREPDVENGFYGGFRCHHGSCATRGWRELTDWIAEEATEQLNGLNSGF